MQGDSSRSNPHPVPFRDAQTATTALADPPIPSKTEAGLPFQETENLPVGTLLTVRLNDLVSGDNAGTSNIFTAVLDEPIKIDGNMIVPIGTAVSGRVESAQISDIGPNRGYIRLNLQSIDIGGREFALQTSSLYARANAHLTFTDGGKTSANRMILEKGRRLTFQLTEPVYMAAQRPIPAR
jgi:hypothetical protein